MSLEYRVTINLRDNSVSSRQDGVKALGALFVTGADRIRVGNVLYEKVSDVAYYDDNTPVRELHYKKC